ncbi:hypothetical protein RSAG8_04692, partial [Rhizoctonia solani AG-8 WAC10335]
MSRRPLRQPIPLRRSSSLCTERGSILSSFSRSNSLTSNSATVWYGLPSLGFPARTESPVEHPTGLAYPWPQTQWINRTPQEGDMGPLIVPIRPDSCPPDPHAFGANFRAMNMMAYPRVASPTSSGSDSDSDYAPGIASEPALDSARRNAMVLDSDQLDMAFQQLHTSNETGKPWLDKSQVSYHDGRGVHGVRHSHRRQGFESRSKNVRFAEDTQPVNAEPPLKPVDNNQQAWYHHVLGAPREHSTTMVVNLHSPDQYCSEPSECRSMTSNVPNNGAPQFNSINTNRPLLSVNTRTKKQVRISPVVDFAPTSLPHSQEAERPSSPSGYSSISESIAEPQTPPSDICMVHIPVASEDVMLPSAQVRYGEEISRQMSINEIIARLVKHGCRNLTGQLDLATFGQFPIANGGFSDVYRGYLRTGQRVAIKSLRVDAQSLSQNPTHLKHAARELHTWCKCNHPNVLQLLGLATFRDRIGMVSPWMSEGSVPQYLRRAPGVNKIHICAQIANGLAYMHGIGIAHGDVKGSNVLVSSDGVPALTDFGNSHLQERTLGFTQSTNGGAMTLRWSAPEVIKDSCTHDKAADIYALGMVGLTIPWLPPVVVIHYYYLLIR